jgi:Protein of unknown function (DUF3800)
MYIAYLDEFGHIGPFTGRNQQKYNENPLFGLGGIVLPAAAVRGFATWFFQLKSNLLGWEIKRSGEAAYTWEKKGSQLYTTTNILKYRQLRTATNRILNQVESIGGKCVYVGLEKYSTPEDHDAKRLYLAVLREIIKRIDQFCEREADQWLLILDEQEKSQFRKQIVATASAEMFGPARRIRLIEPPIQAESHLYQTLQCADWICGLVGRLGEFVCRPDEYADLDWTARYFQARLNGIAPFSSFRRRPETNPTPTDS